MTTRNDYKILHNNQLTRPLLFNQHYSKSTTLLLMKVTRKDMKCDS